MTNLDEIGAIHRTFVFESPRLAKLAWERVEKRCRGIAAYRHLVPRDEGVQYVTALGEVPEADVIERAARLMQGGGGVEVELPSHTIEMLRNRRRRRVVEAWGRGEEPVGGTTRYGESGAFSMPDGRTVLRRRQG